MKAKSTEIAEHIASALSGITVAQNYFTDLGMSVHRGFYAHVLADESTVFPAVVIHPAVEQPSSVRGTCEAVIESTTMIVVSARLGVGDAAYDQVQSCLADVRRALYAAMPALSAITGRDDMTIGAAEPDLSRDSSLVLYAMAVEMKFHEKYQTG